MEVCAGAGRLTRILRYAGKSAASLDIKYWDERPSWVPPCSSNPYDMLTPSGMAILSCTYIHTAAGFMSMPRTPTPASQAAPCVHTEDEGQIRCPLRPPMQQLDNHVEGLYKAELFSPAW